MSNDQGFWKKLEEHKVFLQSMGTLAQAVFLLILVGLTCRNLDMLEIADSTVKAMKEQNKIYREVADSTFEDLKVSRQLLKVLNQGYYATIRTSVVLVAPEGLNARLISDPQVPGRTALRFRASKLHLFKRAEFKVIVYNESNGLLDCKIGLRLYCRAGIEDEEEIPVDFPFRVPPSAFIERNKTEKVHKTLHEIVKSTTNSTGTYLYIWIATEGEVIPEYGKTYSVPTNAQFLIEDSSSKNGGD